MQRIAVPLIKKRVAPYFGCCDELLLLECGDSGPRCSWHVLPIYDSWEFGRHLVSMNVQKVFCGGICSYHKDWLIAHGVEVIDNQRGEVEGIIRLASRCMMAVGQR